MAISLDHVFIITNPMAVEAEHLLAIGLVEGSSNVHPGQGTSNRRFFLEGFTIELLYISDEDEAANGAGKRLGILSRYRDTEASPFGIVVRTTDKDAPPDFPSWQYTPDYFDGKMCFYVGDNSDHTMEPLCICMPPSLPKPKRVEEKYANTDWKLTALEIDVPVKHPSKALEHFAEMDLVQVNFGKPHRMTMTFNHCSAGRSVDLSPTLPLVLEW